MKKVEIDFFKNVKFLSSLKGNKEYLSYVVSETDIDANKYNSNIFLYDMKSKSHRQLTSSNKDNNYYWLNDDEIIFKSSRKDEKKSSKLHNTIFYKININGGEAKEFINLPYSISKLEIVDENTFLFTAAYHENFDKLRELKGHEQSDYIKELEEDDDYEVIEEIPFWSNGGTYSRGKRNAVYLYDKNTSDVKRITPDKFTVLDFSYDKELIIIGKEFIGMSELENQIYKVNLNDLELKNISHSKEYSYKKFIKINEDEIIVYGTDFKKYGMSENGKFGILNLNTSKYKCLTNDLLDSTSNAIGSDLRIGNISSPYYKNDRGIYFTILDNFTSKVMHLSFDGSLTEVKQTGAAVDEHVLIGDEIYFIGLKKDSAQELYKLSDLSRLSNYNLEALEEYSISTPKHIKFKNRANIEIDGFIMKPINFDENKKYPVILNIHGGPKTAYGDILYHEMQYWANEGYGVIYCNPRGSDGKGSDFSDIRGVYGTIDYNDIMDFVDYSLEKELWIDESNLGVTGGSYGGFMTNWIIGHTNRFKAAASQRSIANWVSFFGTSDIGYFFAKDQVASTPWSDIDKMWEQSPLKYADKVKTPTLFIHSQEDYRCWTPDAYQIFTALKYHNIDSRLVLFSQENHELSRSGKPRHRIRRLKEITKWMDKYLK